MSAVKQSEALISVAEYFEGEQHSEVRHEYAAGRVYAMAGASLDHNTIATNFNVEFAIHLRGKPCRTFQSDMKVRIPSAVDDWFYYPDVVVASDPSGMHTYYCDKPAVIVEVLSESTNEKDRREKFFAYFRFATLHTYILAAQDKREVIVYRRAGDDWTRETLTGNDTLRVPELEFTTGLDALYARTDV